MRDLDEKLRKIVSLVNMVDMQTQKYLTEDEAVAQIKQAFTDAGYSTFRDRDGLKFQTGQMWYDRFKKELGKWSSLTLQDIQQPLIVQSRTSVMEAAKKAAGIK